MEIKYVEAPHSDPMSVIDFQPAERDVAPEHSRAVPSAEQEAQLTVQFEFNPAPLDKPSIAAKHAGTCLNSMFLYIPDMHPLRLCFCLYVFTPIHL